MTTPATHSLNENEFFDLIAGKKLAFILGTSSPDKRAKYKMLWNLLDNGQKTGDKGINSIFTHTGALGITPNYVAEKEGDYETHALLKVAALTETLALKEDSIRARFQGSGMDAHVAKQTVLVGMTEDSGWEVVLNEAQKKPFLDKVTELLAERFRPQDRQWLFNHITSSFPGPNLKPFQEHLPGGFNELMEVIYDAAESIGMSELRYRNTIQLAFGVQGKQGENNVFTKNIEAVGTVMNRDQFYDMLHNLPAGVAINTDCVQIPDGQTSEVPETFAQLNDRSFSTHSSKLPFSFARRECGEWLQQHLGVQQPAQPQDIHIAYVSPSEFEGGQRVMSETTQTLLTSIAGKHVSIVSIPTRNELRTQPSKRLLNGSDIIVLKPEPVTQRDGLIYDPNLMLADYIGISVLTDPLSMGKPVILDNRSGEFNHVLEIFRQGYQSGRFMGEFPFMVATSDTELHTILQQQADQLGNVIIRSDEVTQTHQETGASSLILPPDDGILSVLVAGGHTNNNRQDMEEAQAFGYYLAQQRIRIVTGGGVAEGSMGATHTGFIQYHLDQLKEDYTALQSLQPSQRGILHQFNFNAEEMILKNPDLLNDLADLGHIPRSMFYAYSTQPLVDMESPNQQWPCATFFQDTGNRICRLEGLMAAGTKVFLPGSTGTDEEIMHAFKQVMEERMAMPAANDNSPYSDGTPQRQGKIILYNRETLYASVNDKGALQEKTHGVFDGILQTYGLMKADRSLNNEVLQTYGIEVVPSLHATKSSVDMRHNQTASWREKLIAQQQQRDEPTLRRA